MRHTSDRSCISMMSPWSSWSRSSSAPILVPMGLKVASIRALCLPETACAWARISAITGSNIPTARLAGSILSELVGSWPKPA